MSGRRFSRGVADEIVDAIATGCSVADAARGVAVPLETVRTWLRKGRAGEQVYAAFARDVADARAVAAERPMTGEELEVCLARAIRGGSVQAMRLWSDREAERRYERREPDELDALQRRYWERRGSVSDNGKAGMN